MGYYYRGFDLNNPSDIHPDDIARTQRIVQADGGNPDDFVQVLNVLNFGSHLGRRPDGSFSNTPFVARVRMADGYRRPPEPTPEQQNNPTPAGSPPPNTATAPSPQAPAPAPAAPTGALSRPAATQSPQGTNAGGPTGPIGPIDSGTGSSGVSITAARIAEDFGLEDLGDGMYSLGPAGGSVTGEALLECMLMVRWAQLHRMTHPLRRVRATQQTTGHKGPRRQTPNG